MKRHVKVFVYLINRCLADCTLAQRLRKKTITSKCHVADSVSRVVWKIWYRSEWVFEECKNERSIYQQKFINKKRIIICLADKARRCCAHDIKDKRIDDMNYKRNRRAKSGWFMSLSFKTCYIKVQARLLLAWIESISTIEFSNRKQIPCLKYEILLARELLFLGMCVYIFRNFGKLCCDYRSSESSSF